jgi:prevent-host-death family protein
MQTYNIHDAKTQLSKLVELAAKGESFVIAKAGKPMVKVVALNAPEPSQMKRIGFLAGQAIVPKANEFNALGGEEIAAMFDGSE